MGEITPKGDPVNKVYRVRIALPEDTPLRIGMSAEINIITQRRDGALLLPAGAIKDGAVWVARDGRAERRAVEVGVRGREQVEARAGLTEGETVILDPPADLSEGARVRVAGE